MLVASRQICSSVKRMRGIVPIAYLVLAVLIGTGFAPRQSPEAGSAAPPFPDKPRMQVNTSLPASGGKIIQVAKGGDLQQAINAARPGSTLVLEPGAAYTGNFTLPQTKPNNAGAEGWIIIQSAAPDSALPAG
ncbi:MAG TPA: hypothetical protein VN345_19635, partial [Blastocatellia bacterium]|nr:hypothetical protein [Blastocatellia bacterium]